MTDPSLLQACRDAPWDMVSRMIYADWLEEHGEAEQAAKFRDPNDGPTLLSLLPDPVWHPPIVDPVGPYELTAWLAVGILTKEMCELIQLKRCRNRFPGDLPVAKERLFTNTLSLPSPTWNLTWSRQGESTSFGRGCSTVVQTRNYVARYSEVTAESFRDAMVSLISQTPIVRHTTAD